jgi:hypothetical protein
VRTPTELVAATAREGAAVEIVGEVAGMPMTVLAPGVKLRGGTLRFGAKGLVLTRDNVLEDLTIETAEHEAAILNDTAQSTLGTLSLARVRTVGQVLLIAGGNVGGGHIEVEGLSIERADLRGRISRPRGFGVEAMPGGFTLWNRQADPACRVTARLVDVSAGSRDAPVRGSGVFVAGTAGGGQVGVSQLRTGEIFTDGGIAPSTPDLISGGVFVVTGAMVEEVVTAGAVTTLGQNDMVLDNWGEVGKWIALAPVTSHGASAIGFVNFGTIETLDVRAPLSTYGTGARGFNLYDGRLDHAIFASIATMGDGAVGIQVARELPLVEIRGDLKTSGGRGQSLVKGVLTVLPATALSIQPGGSIGRVAVGGRLETAGDDVVTLDVEGDLGEIAVSGGIGALGAGSEAVQASAEIAGLDTVQINTRSK